MKGRPGSEWLKVVSYQKTGDKKQSESCDDNLEKFIFQDQERIMLEIKRFKKEILEITKLFEYFE